MTRGFPIDDYSSLKKEFDNIKDYSEKLRFWEKHFHFEEVVFYVYPNQEVLSFEEDEYLKEDINKLIKFNHGITILPTNIKEREEINNWYIKNYLERNKGFNFEYKKNWFNKTVKISPRPFDLFTSEAQALIEQLYIYEESFFDDDSYYHPPLSTQKRIFRNYKLYGESPNLKIEKTHLIGTFLKCKFLIDYDNFLQEYKNNMWKPLLSDPIIQEPEIIPLELGTQMETLILLYSIGFFDLPKISHLTKEKLAELIHYIMGANANSIRPILSVVRSRNPESKHNPWTKDNTEKLLRKLDKLGLNEIYNTVTEVYYNPLLKEIKD